MIHDFFLKLQNVNFLESTHVFLVVLCYLKKKTFRVFYYFTIYYIYEVRYCNYLQYVVRTVVLVIDAIFTTFGLLYFIILNWNPSTGKIVLVLRAGCHYFWFHTFIYFLVPGAGSRGSPQLPICYSFPIPVSILRSICTRSLGCCFL